MVVLEVKGIDVVLANLDKHKKGMGRAIARGLKEAGTFLQRKSQAICPVDIGNLRASAFTRAFGEGLDIDVIVGYNTEYAIYVHENLDAVHGAAFNLKYADRIAGVKGRRSRRRKLGLKGIHNPFDKTRGKDQQAKFLEAPTRMYQKDIIKIVADEAAKV